ncbi:bcl-2-interacting killer isoform X2 [Leopardus geoffroyi]|uniref:bcl-2-interacting killer isoform X2 n=1 Tax=Leopardus geoffroyi TaxID=46844 RepID=UPI001E264093|nr:bcl-2-interacting killer isoform X2 [Leopardus geoffroyi]
MNLGVDTNIQSTANWGKANCKSSRQENACVVPSLGWSVLSRKGHKRKSPQGLFSKRGIRGPEGLRNLSKAKRPSWTRTQVAQQPSAPWHSVPVHREEMSHAGPLSRNVFLSTFLQEHGPEVLDVPGMTDLVEYYDPGPSPNSNSPDDVAMRLAFIGDEMEVRWMMPRVGELPGMAVYSLAFTYNQTGLRGVLRSLMAGLANLRENIRIWGFLTLRSRVSPNSGRGLALSLLLLVLLLGWGLHLLQ